MTPWRSWLYLRAADSIQVVWSGKDTIIVNVRGPGAARRVYGFDDEPSSQNFLNRMQRKLVADGWFLVGENVERRSGSDRRMVPRSSLDRRRRW